MFKIEEGLLYSPTHEWVKVEGNRALIGITDFAQKSLGSVVFVDMPSLNTHFAHEDDFGAIESVKAASDLVMPLGGKIIRINEDLEDSPELINDDCYANFIIEIEIDDLDELNTLLNASQYAELIK